MSDEAMRAALRKVVKGHHLDEAEASAVFRELMRGDTHAGQIGGLLVGLSAKGESIDEIRGAARAMREALIEVPIRSAAIDTCGTGGSGIPRRNVSTAAALAVAACGVHVAKHGNRAASSRSGSADVLEALGVRIEAGAEVVAECVDEIGVGFLFARALHPAMGHAAPVRKALGVRTLFNLLGPLTNPARVRRQVIGCFDPTRLSDLAAALGGLGSDRVFVVHGFRAGVTATAHASPGIDDLSPDGESLVAELDTRGKSPEVHMHVLRPEDAGLDPMPLDELRGGEPEENARALRALLDGDHGAVPGLAAYQAAVEYAGGLSLLVASDEPISALPRKVLQIRHALEGGDAARVLDRLVERTRAS